MNNGRYGNILSALRQGTDARAAATALANSPWGTGSLVLRMLGGSPVSAPTAPSPTPVVQPTKQPPSLLPLFAAGAQMFGYDPLPLQELAAAQPQVRVRQPVRQTQAATPKRSKAGSTIQFLEHTFSPFGLSVTSTTGGKHAPHSYHYQRRAVDFAGTPQAMAEAQQHALEHPELYREAFYTGPGAAPWYVKDGKVYPISSLDPSVAADHRDHFHAAA